jgi:DNA-directed RNA polymerase subunit M/transcription elongation factor TFIIS
MHFCTQCSNMYYTRITTDPDSSLDSLMYYCQQCGNEEKADTEFTRVLVTSVNKSSQTFNRFINKYTKLDPSLPRIRTIECPNTECITHTETPAPESDIIYIRYDNVGMKYVYTCTHCDKIWTNDNNI